MTDRPFAIHDLPAPYFPFTVEAMTPDRTIVWTATIEQPAPGRRLMLEIPPLAKIHGAPITIRIRFADGDTQEWEP
jgi:hypothetical protein